MKLISKDTERDTMKSRSSDLLLSHHPVFQSFSLLPFLRILPITPSTFMNTGMCAFKIKKKFNYKGNNRPVCGMAENSMNAIQSHTHNF